MDHAKQILGLIQQYLDGAKRANKRRNARGMAPWLRFIEEAARELLKEVVDGRCPDNERRL